MIISGILLGLSTLLFLGPVLFYLLKSSMESGFKAGVAVASGIILGDIICVILVLSGGKYIIESEASQIWVALFAGILVLSIGLKYILKPDLNTEKKMKASRKSLLLYFTNGFLVNFVNPFVLPVWLGFVAYNQAKYDETETLISLTITLAIIFSTDLLKAFYVHKVIGLIRPARLRIIFRLFGVIMVLFAIRLLIYALF